MPPAGSSPTRTGPLGRLFHAYEFFDSAEASYLNATRLAPGDATWPHLLGYLYQQTGRLEEAAESFEQALRAQPDDRARPSPSRPGVSRTESLREAREQFDTSSLSSRRWRDTGWAKLRSASGGSKRRSTTFARCSNECLRHRRSTTRSPWRIAGSVAWTKRDRIWSRRGAGGITVGDPIVDSLQTLVRGERGLVVQGRRAYEAGQYQRGRGCIRQGDRGGAGERQRASQPRADAVAIGQYGRCPRTSARGLRAGT